MCGLEQQHHFLRLMSLTSPPVPQQEVKANGGTQMRTQTHPVEGEGGLRKTGIRNFTFRASSTGLL